MVVADTPMPGEDPCAGIEAPSHLDEVEPSEPTSDVPDEDDPADADTGWADEGASKVLRIRPD